MIDETQRPKYAHFASDFRLVFTHFAPILPLPNQKILDFRDFDHKFGKIEFFFTKWVNALILRKLEPKKPLIFRVGYL